MRSRAIAAAFLAVGIGLAGCAASGDSAEPSTPPTLTATQAPTPTPTPTPLTPGEQAAQQVARMTIAEQAALVVMGTAPGTDAAALADYVSVGPDGLILMGGNVPATPDELRGLTDTVHAASDQALIAIDQEGGDVRRMPWDELASSYELKTAAPAETQAAFAARAGLLAAAGVDINFGIVADVPRTQDSFIFGRSYGTDPQAVADRVAAAVAGERGVVASTLKHFPGHGAAEGDSHSAIPTSAQTLAEWRTFDAIPFEAGIDAGAELVMTGHLRFPSIAAEPASLSPEWYRILREDLGFDGVAVTDDLGMLGSSGEVAYADPVANSVAAIAAGADLVLMIAGSTPETAGQIITALEQRASTDATFAERLAEAASRVLMLKSTL
ncbi:glycoside hydrolase family 3 N-terminal domain-containing protein [Microbacterium sp. A196]|uniref:glycoside hydrolase family 3 N-terminal domain-containing protein n=1 Tax=Microbacterium sp. A196 TaxID=3457320 RepID=UPI003FD698C7